MSANIMDSVASRDFDYLRARASKRANASHIITVAAIGTCPIDAAGAGAVTCSDYSVDYLCANYNMVVIAFRALAPGLNTTLTPNPLDTVFCPVAVSMVVRDSADPTLSRTSFVFSVGVRKCEQLDFENATDSVAAATGWIDTQAEWDPTFKESCKACPVDWACFTNPGLNSATMRMIVGNPHAAPTTGKLTIWGVPYSCCPQFIPADDYQNGRRRRTGVTAGAAAPMGTAKRPGSPFAPAG